MRNGPPGRSSKYNSSTPRSITMTLVTLGASSARGCPFRSITTMRHDRSGRWRALSRNIGSPMLCAKHRLAD
eukprot:825059-Heterocapsa_arctica.AAC.1